MGTPLLTKSDFKVAADCRTKLYYRKNGYATTLDDNEYLQFLADGGFMVEFIAKARFPDGIDLVAERDAVVASEKTRVELGKGDVVLFEAAATIGKLHVRTDILEKKGRTLNLIEVKSSSIEDDDEDDAKSPFITNKGAIVTRWKPYLMDVAFQTYVLRLAFPDLEVKPHLCVVNKSMAVSAGETLERFSLKKVAGNAKARPMVTYAGDPSVLRDSALLVVRPVAAEVEALMPEVIKKAEALLALLSPDGVTRLAEDFPERYNDCRKCEFRVDVPEKNGFRECWGKLATNPTHILDLHRVSQIKSKAVPDPVPPLLRRGSSSYLDLSIGDLGAEGAYQARRLMQWQSMREGGREILPNELREALSDHAGNPGYPFHFIDFEACDLALPHHAGLCPYERVAFQWSCHKLDDGGTLTHGEWLNTRRDFPNFAFAQSLRSCIGDSGTVYVWSSYEQVTLRKVLEQIQAWMQRDPETALRLSRLRDAAELASLARWIEALIGPADAKGKRQSPRIRDLLKLASDYYFHPRMAGRLSIKVVLPAVWESDEKVRSHPCFAAYKNAGPKDDPYKFLPALPFGDDDSEDAVREGTGAIRVYQDLIFDAAGDSAESAKRQQLLLQYCGLDTAAMVMIWMHWTRRYEIKPARA